MLGNFKHNIILPQWIHIVIVQRVSDFKVPIKILKRPTLNYHDINISIFHIISKH